MKNLFIYILVFICSLIFSLCYGQNKIKIKLIYNITDINKQSNDTLNMKRIGIVKHSDNIFIILKNRNKITFPPGKIWGYRDSRNTIYRYFDGDFYYVRQLDTMIIYSRKGGKSNKYYFSEGGNGKILRLSTNSLKKEFAKNDCFLKKIANGFKWYQDYSAYNKKIKSYRIVEYYKICLNNIQAEGKKN